MTSGSPHQARRLALIVDTQREIAAAGNDLQAVMRMVGERSMAITNADGAMVSFIRGDQIETMIGIGIAEQVQGAVRPLAESVARHGIMKGQPILIEDCESDPRINQNLRAKVGDRSLICVPLFHRAEVIGTLNVMSRSVTDRLDEDDRQTLEMLSVVLSAAISHAAEFEARRAHSEAFARFRTLFEGASIGIIRLGADGRAVEANPAIEAMLGYGERELAERDFRAYVHPEDVDEASGLFAQLMAGEREAYQLEVRYVRKNGEVLWGLVRAALERDVDAAPAFAVTMVENITERKRAEAELIRQSQLNEYQALHDALTGLPNRTLFAERIDQAIKHAERHGTRVAILMMDLNRFKEVNDSLGHQAGDVLLEEVGARISGALRASDSVARLGGDEFGLLLPEPSEPGDVVTVIERVRAALERPVCVQDLPLAVEGAIGIAMYPDDGCDADVLLKRADVAMYAAKHENAPYGFYDGEADEIGSDHTHLTLVAELRRAIEEDELVLVYQPKAILTDGEVRSVEALLRWEHPERGTVMPDSFIPVAQETGIIRALTLYVLNQALAQSRAWSDEGLELAISVNLSMRNLLDLDFPRQVAELLERWQVAPTMLELEITESTMLANPARTRCVLEQLAALGMKLSIDDFGTGYSSLAYLRELPIHEIKIDRSFVSGMEADDDDMAIVRSTIDLGRNLGLEVVAEGVETRETWEHLRRLGCSVAQGFYLSRPVPPSELHDWLKQRAARQVEQAA